MYHAIVARIVRQAFEAVNDHDYDALIAKPARHPSPVRRQPRAGGRASRHGGVARVVRAARSRAAEPQAHGDGYLGEGLSLEDHGVRPLDGDGRPGGWRPYANRGVHIVTMRWGKVASIDANEDSQAVAEVLRRQVRAGIVEAGAPMILS